MHRDIKPENIFLTEQNKLKYGDLGVSRRLFTKDNNDLTRLVGSPNYMSPEIVYEKDYNCKSDVWSLGCVLYELITLNKLFDGNVCFNTFHQILNKQINFKIETTNKLQYILYRSLLRDPDQRADSFELKAIFEVLFYIFTFFFKYTLSRGGVARTPNRDHVKFARDSDPDSKSLF